MSERSKDLWSGVVSHALAVLVGGSLAFGVTMLSAAKQIVVNTNDIEHLKITDATTMAEVNKNREELNSRILSVASLVTENLRTERELIDLLKLQNNLKNNP